MEIKSLPLGTTALSLLRGSTTTSANSQNLTNKNTNEDATNTLFDQLDPDVREKLKAQQDSLSQTLSQLQSSRESVDEMRKANAQQKIQQIKAKLAALRLLAAVNPKAAARQAAQLARELASAVKDYSGSSGSGNVLSGGGNVIGATPTATSATAPTATVATAGATATASATGVSVSSVTVPVANANDADVDTESSSTASASGDVSGTEPVAQENAAVDGTKNADAKEDETAKVGDDQSLSSDKEESDSTGKTDDEKRAAYRESVNEQISSMQKNAAANQANIEFKKEVEGIVSQLRSIMEMGKRKQNDEKKDASLDNELQKGESALQDIGSTLAQMGAGAMTNLVSVDVSAVSVAVSTVMPVNITA